MPGSDIAFVLGGGGQLGAHEVGMLRALLERGIVPDLVLGTSIGAINGAAVAADPTVAAIERLEQVWTRIESSDAFSGGILGRLGTLARTRTHLHDNDGLRRLLTEALPAERIEELPVAFQCVAASIEAASERWFAEGPLVDAILASSAVPGLLPPVAIGGEHFLDGGIVNSIPVGRAVALGARTIYVLHVGRVDRPLEVPRWPWEVGLVGVRDRPPASVRRRPGEPARRHRRLRAADRPDRAAALQRPRPAAALPRHGQGARAHRRRLRRIRPRPRRPRRMKVPPKLVRRLVIAPLVVAVEALLVLVSPLILLVALLVSPFFGGWRPLRAALLVLSGTTRHMAAIVSCLGLWVASGFGRRLHTEPMQRAHYDLMRWFVSGVYDTIVALARVRVEVEASAKAGAVLSARDRPVLLLSRHAGEGDTLLVIYELLCPHERGPRIVMHERLRLDPLVDVLGGRLPNRFVDPRGGDTERDIAEMAATLDEASALVIFPRVATSRPPTASARSTGCTRPATPRRPTRRGACTTSAPRGPAGRSRRWAAAPGADVVVMGHAGFPTGLADVWRQLPVEQVVRVRLWHEPASAVPDDRDAQIAWLFGWWRTLDAWVGEHEVAAGS
jgi:NTE family protein